jgi:hypothetical protein
VCLHLQHPWKMLLGRPDVADQAAKASGTQSSGPGDRTRRSGAGSREPAGCRPPGRRRRPGSWRATGLMGSAARACMP